MVAKKTKKSSKCASFRKSLSLSERITVIKEYEKTPNTRAIAEMFKCSLTQIKNIIRRKEEYLEEFMNNGSLGRIKRRQSARFLTVGVIVCEWLYRMKRNGEDVDDDLIISFGKEVAEKLNLSEVRTNNNWLERMRLKFKISNSELRDVCYVENEDFKESVDLDDIIQDLRSYCPEEDMPISSLVFPYELIKQYLRNTGADEAHDISKIRMRACLEEAKDDKYMKVDGALQLQTTRYPYYSYHSSQIEEDEEEQQQLDISEFIFNRSNNITVKTEITEDYPSEHSNESGGITENQIALLNENQIFITPLANVNIKEEVLTKGIGSYREAYNILGPMEHFALAQKDITAMGLINQLENHFQEKIMNVKK